MATGISNEKFKDLDEIRKETKRVFEELYAKAKPEKNSILVVGCSTSEVASHSIGSFSSEEIGKVLFDTLNYLCNEKGLYLATQCCEHLNRAIIIEKEVAIQNRLDRVNVVPQLKAGGSFSTAAYNGFKEPVAVEHIEAQLGIDIGDTLIGMHLQDVAVPVRIDTTEIGSAHVVCARTRLKYIGGERAHYIED